MGLSASNYAGTNAIFINPANTVDTRYKFFLNVATAGAELQNNYIRWKAPYSLMRLATGTVAQRFRGDSGLPLWRPDYYKYRDNINSSRTFLNMELRGPALMFNMPSKKIGVAAGQRMRFLGSLTGTSLPIAKAISSGTKNPELQNTPFTDLGGNMNLGLYNELFLSAGLVLREDDSFFYKIGGTLKRITSNNSLSVLANNLSYEITPNSTRPLRQDISVAQSSGAVFESSENISFGIPWLMKRATSINGFGSGFGADIGVVFEYRPEYIRQRYRYKNDYIPDPSINKYQWKLGISITDIGYVKFKRSDNVRVAVIENMSTFIAPGTFNNISSTKEFLDDIGTIYNLNNQYDGEYHVFMPASLNIQGDYHWKDNKYLAINWRQALLGQNRIGGISYSGISFIPRIEKRFIEYSFPISFENNYTNLNLGAGMRAGPLYFGMDNFTGLFNWGNPRGASLMAGLMMGIGHRRPENELLKCFGLEKKKQGIFKRKRN